MSSPKELLVRTHLPVPISTKLERLGYKARSLLQILLLGPKAVADGKKLERVLIDLKFSVFTPKSVRAYQNALVEKFFTSAKSIGLYPLYVRPQRKVCLSIIEDCLCEYFPEPLQKLRKSAPRAQFLIKTIEVFGTVVARFLLVRQGNKMFHLHLFEGEEKRMVMKIIGRGLFVFA